jgi:hypothetical protein
MGRNNPGVPCHSRSCQHLLCFSAPGIQANAPRDHFSRKFRYPSLDWGTPNRYWDIHDGKLTIRAELDYGQVLLNKVRKFEDADISVKLSPETSPVTSPTVGSSPSPGLWLPGGIVFWAPSEDDFFVFYINRLGKFSLSRWAE